MKHFLKVVINVTPICFYRFWRKNQLIVRSQNRKIYVFSSRNLLVQSYLGQNSWSAFNRLAKYKHYYSVTARRNYSSVLSAVGLTKPLSRLHQLTPSNFKSVVKRRYYPLSKSRINNYILQHHSFMSLALLVSSGFYRKEQQFYFKKRKILKSVLLYLFYSTCTYSTVSNERACTIIFVWIFSKKGAFFPRLCGYWGILTTYFKIFA